MTALLVLGFVEGAAWLALRRLAQPSAPPDVSNFLGETAPSDPGAGPHRPTTKITEADLDPMVDPKYKRVNGQGPTRVEVLHPYVGFVLTPADPSNEAFADVGWLHQVIYKRSPDQVIVGLTGGSVARQLTEEAAPALVEALANGPRFRGKKIVLVGLNMGGFKQPQQLMALNYLLTLGAEFDVLINLDGFNEVALHEAENGPKGVFPIFPRWWNRRVNDAGDTTIRLYAGELAYLRRQVRDVSSEDDWLGHFNIVKAWRAFRVRRLQKDINRVVGEILSSSSGRAVKYLASGPQWQFTEDELYDHLVSIWSRSSLQMHQLCRANGIEYHHFLQPNQYVEGGKPMDDEELARAFDPNMRYRPGAVKGYPRLVRAGARLKEQGVPFTDLTRMFANQKAPAYADSCCHFLPEAANQLARAVAAVVTETAATTR
jgi:hypothetical protein